MATIPSYYTYAHNTWRVSTATTLGNVWTERPHLHVESLALLAAPDIDQCLLSYRTGYFATREADEFGGSVQTVPQWFDALTVTRHFVKVELLDRTNLTAGEPTVIVEWYGVIEVDDRNEAQQADEETHRTGFQMLTAFGLLRLLETVIIDSSEVKKPSGSEFQTIGRGLPFNFDSRGALQRRGNRTSAKRGDTYVFDFLPYGDDDENPEGSADYYWNASDAVRYLLEYHRPVDQYDDDLCEWVCEPLVREDLPVAFYDITVPTDRRTVKSVLDDLIDRRRMVGYWVYGRINDSDQFEAVLKCFTFTADEIPTDSGSVPANPNTDSLIAGASTIVTSVKVSQVATHQVDELIVEGAPITSTITLRPGENDADVVELAEGWSSDQEDDYKDGASGDETENTISRARDSMRDVFARFFVDTDWPGTVARDDGGVKEYWVTLNLDNVTIDDGITDGDVEALFLKGSDADRQGPLAFHGKGFLELLPLKDARTNESRRPFVAMAEGDAGTPDPDDKWAFCEHVSTLSINRKFNCHLYMLTDRLGIRIEVDKAGGQQLIAKDAWAGADDTPTDLDPDSAEGLNYENMRLTVTLEWDDRVRVTQSLGTASGQKRILRIIIPDARLDFLLPGTIRDIDTDGDLKISDGEVVKDDRSRLRSILAAAAAWYGETRQAITITYRELNPYLEIGTLLTQLWGVSDEPINTPVTGIQFNTGAGTTTIETCYAEIDFASIAGKNKERTFVKKSSSRQA